ncbi:hypothetical protein [Bacillus thuringiensis]|uniref:hypothetical protein n=1 Tax=Bacillus thuringiensis TaxID=1428 RepID=UPI003F51E6BB
MGYEIYHIGQLFIWMRELNLQPVSVNLKRMIELKTDLYLKRKSVLYIRRFLN